MEDVKPTVPATEDKPVTPQVVNDITAPLPTPEQAEPTKDTEVRAEPGSSDNEQQPQHGQVADKPKAKVPKQHGSGFAIFAAVLIILGLGAMFTYAYLQTQ